MNSEELKGKAEALKGRAKQAVGDITDDEKLHDEGVADEAEGNVRDAIGRGRRKVGDTLNDLGDAIKK